MKRRYLLRRGLIVVWCMLLSTTALLWVVTAHAAGPIVIQPHTCFDRPNIENCNDANPISTHCTQHARVMQDQLAMFNNMPVGYVDLRTSDQCRTYWVRAVAYADSGVDTIIVTIQVAADAIHPLGLMDTEVSSHPFFDGSKQAYSSMTYLSPPPISGTYAQFVMTNGRVLTINI